MTPDSPTIVLDLDGVILRSNAVKRRAMIRLFSGHAEHAAAIDAYVTANAGVRRDHKIIHILHGLLGLPADAATVERYLARYDMELAAELAAVALVPGVAALLARDGYRFYVCSSAPEEEVRAQLDRRGLTHRFAAVFGAATQKAEALRRIRERHPGSAITFFGDSPLDFEAARAAGVPFVGIVGERDDFGDLPVTRLADFTDLEALDKRQ
jgi:phosphoglycolate phosphatase-like HAD superfamily hydrolase